MKHVDSTRFVKYFVQGGCWRALKTMKPASPWNHLSYSLNSLKGESTGGYIGDYYRGY